MCKFIVKYLESVVLTPCTPLLKSEGVPIIGDLIGAGASVYNTSETNKTNAESVEKTNETNYQIAKEVNAQSEKQFQTNLKWLQQQYYENQEREDSRYQRMVKDMQASGLNPALQNGQPSSVSSVGAPSPSSFHAAQMEAAHYDPLNLDFDALSDHAANAINSYYQNKKVQAETENIHNDSQTKAIENWTKLQRDSATFFETLAKIDNLISSTNVNKEQKEYLVQQRDNLKQNWELINRQFEDLAIQPYYQNSLLKAQEGDAQESMNLKKAQQMAISAGLGLTAAQTAAVYQSIQESISNIKTSEGYLDLASKETQQKIISMINQDAATFESIGISKELMGSEKFKNYASAIISGIAAGVGAYVGLRTPKIPLKPNPVRGFGSSVPWQKSQ